VSRAVADAAEAEAVMGRIRTSPPDVLAGFDVTVTDLHNADHSLRTDAVVLSGGDGETTFRMVVRPSGTEPKVKSYIEVRSSDVSDLGAARLRAANLQARLQQDTARW
jgi:phosphomannomutase